MDVGIWDALREETDRAVAGLTGVEDTGPCGHGEVIDICAAAGDK